MTALQVFIGGVWYPANKAGGDSTFLMVTAPDGKRFPVTAGYYPTREVP
jgi:hypothetical protein